METCLGHLLRVEAILFASEYPQKLLLNLIRSLNKVVYASKDLLITDKFLTLKVVNGNYSSTFSLLQPKTAKLLKANNSQRWNLLSFKSAQIYSGKGVFQHFCRIGS